MKLSKAKKAARKKLMSEALEEIMPSKLQTTSTSDDVVRQIIELWCSGVSGKKVARQLGVSNTTVGKYVGRLKKQLGSSKNRFEKENAAGCVRC